MRELAAEFYQLFRGLDRAHGSYTVPPGTRPNDKGKIEPDQRHRNTIKSGPTVDLWMRHLRGEYGLGIVPIMDDGRCWWGAQDVDVYGIDLPRLNAEVQKRRLPLVLARTKSGGAHLYCFVDEPVPAALMRERLMEWATALGFPGIEIFPKQTRLAGPNDHGSWLNMPYQNAAETLRYALDPQTSARLGPEEFLQLAKRRTVTQDELSNFRLEVDANIAAMLRGSPPCLKVLAERGFPDGTRNNGLFNVAVYFKKRLPDTWANEVSAFNQQFMKPPLEHTVVATTIKSVRKKDYSYRCKEPPINAVCNKQICLTCEFGVGDRNDDPGVVFGEMLKLDFKPDPVWIWSVNGARLELETDQLLSQYAFNKAVVNTLNITAVLIPQHKWLRLVGEYTSHAQIYEPPTDSHTTGVWMVLLQRFCTQRSVARNLDEILLGKPFPDKETGRTYFQSIDFIDYLQRQRITGVTTKRVYAWLKDHNVMHHHNRIKGKMINYWSMPNFDDQDSPHAVPEEEIDRALDQGKPPTDDDELDGPEM